MLHEGVQLSVSQPPLSSTSALLVRCSLFPPLQMTVDRATIERHFLTSQTDPFSRTPLALDGVRPNAELQQRAQEWLRSRGRA